MLTVRVLLYFLVAVVLGPLALGLVAYLWVTAAVAGVAALLGGDVAVVALLGVAGLLAGLLVAAGLVVGARWLDRRLIAADRRPDPVEAAKRRYVREDVDEAELERALEDALWGHRQQRAPSRSRPSRGPTFDGTRRSPGPEATRRPGRERR